MYSIDLIINIIANLVAVGIMLLPFIIIALIINGITKLGKKKKEDKKENQYITTIQTNKPYRHQYKQQYKQPYTSSIPKQTSVLNYTDTDYYKETHTSYEDMITDKGKAGEYATYCRLKELPGYKRFLFDTYIPDKDGVKNKTEIDIIMIHETGIYVIECKNFKGWIIGDETSDKWCQTFKSGKKYFFYNPIKQNYRHIQYLRGQVGEDKRIESIIAFGDDAVLKKITNTNQALKIINNREIYANISRRIAELRAELSSEEIDNMYNRFKSTQW